MSIATDAHSMHSDDLPLCAFIDTQVFRAIRFNWRHPNLVSLRERVAKGSVTLVATNILVREIHSGLRILLNELSQHLQKAALRADVAKVLQDPRLEALASLASDKLDVRGIADGADTFLRDLEVEIVPYPDGALDRLLDMYFDGKPPFNVKGKKSEFPDAANLVALEAHAARIGKSIYVISGDTDWKQACANHPSLIHVEHLSSLLDLAVRSEWLSDDLWSDDELLDLIKAKKDVLTRMLQDALRMASTVNLGDGELDDLTIEVTSLDGLSITSISQLDDAIIFSGELFHSISYEATASLEDLELHNALEEYFTGDQEMAANITVELSLGDLTNAKSRHVDYTDGLALEIATKF